MKKRNLKLELKKVNVSNLSSINGGNNSNTCPVITDPDQTNACPNTQLTTCHSGIPKCTPDPTGNCLTHEETCICFFTDGVPCI